MRLRVVGKFETADYERAIHERAAALGVAELIEWRGFTRQINAELAAMDLLVLPSLFGEGLPMVVLEAMAAGVPVLAAKVGGLPDLIDDGKNGLFCDPLDAASMKSGVSRILDDSKLARELATTAKTSARERFHPLVIARKHLEIYREVLSNPS